MKWPFSVEMAWFPFVSSDFFPPFSVLSLSFMWVFAKFFLWSQTRQLKEKKKKKGYSLEALSQTVRSQFLDPLLVKYTHLIIEFKISFSFSFSFFLILYLLNILILLLNSSSVTDSQVIISFFFLILYLLNILILLLKSGQNPLLVKYTHLMVWKFINRKW